MYKQNIAPMKDGAYIICGDDGGSMDLTQLSNGSPWRVCGRTWKYYADNVDDLQTQIEWNYYRGWAYGLSGNKLKASFLIFHDGDLDSRMQDGVSFHQCNTVNSMSHRLLFPDVTWDGKITKEEFLHRYRDPNNYRPELPINNRSHKYE